MTTIRKVGTERVPDLVQRITDENVRLRALNAELVAALLGLTPISKTPDGGIVIGPRGWALAMAALAKTRQ